ncbi:HEPN domain-containing protein [Pseudoduganella albidiflava]|uniref:Uncharacterized protein n=1 Tax=Pseudoduganella albidiflava TaxID=321983 RepID=A0A411X2B2_9BURK|nr:HEPN domain-containing protein [Pseudoduganella albidiflava]QBI03109.1 hypothetical protein EYF70_21435 [Pseudoduganella albidiflava]GGY69859.1 hypothetical protein GCM10007387_59770 [Pseudoduganella albidiflava]
MNNLRPLTVIVSEIEGCFSEHKHSLDMPLYDLVYQIGVPKEKRFSYLGAMKELFLRNDVVATTISYENFQKKTNEFVLKSRRDGEQHSDSTIKSYLQSLIKRPIGSMRVFTELSGTSLKTEKPIDLGVYRIYDVKKHSQEIAGDSFQSHDGLHLEFGGASTLISVVVQARDAVLAQEAGASMFKQFESALSYMINNRTSGSGVRVSSGGRFQRIYACSPDGERSGRAQKLESGVQPDIGDHYFCSAELGHKYFWEITSIDKKNRSEVQNRLVAAVDWVGQALLERSSENSLLKAAISVEILFNADKDQVVRTISESVGQICGENPESKMHIEKEIKGLYTLRSQLVHGGKHTVTPQEAHDFVNYAVNCVHLMLTEPDLVFLKTKKDLAEYFARLRYGYKS